MDYIPDIVLVLNRNRQTVFANKSVIPLFELTKVASAYGLRPGELIDCTHAYESRGGCGTTKFCAECGKPMWIDNSDDVEENYVDAVNEYVCDKRYESDLCIQEGTDAGMPKGKIFVGIQLASWSDDGDDADSVSDLVELTKRIEELGKKLNIKNTPIQIITGTRCS